MTENRELRSLKYAIAEDTDDGLGFIEGQLIPWGVPVEVALRVARLASAGQWTTAFYDLEGNPVAVRILQRVREMRHE